MVDTALRGSVKVPRGETAKLQALWLLCLTNCLLFQAARIWQLCANLHWSSAQKSPLRPPGSHRPTKLTQSLDSSRHSFTRKTLSSQFPYGFLFFALQDSVQVLHFVGMSCLADTISPKHTHPLFSPCR